ncbi:MAG: hypothetical protein RLZZ524_345 [Pseudomonadota bacterium]|jgi:hypothetical protein
MRLARVATRFDRTPCFDAYLGHLAFYGQMALFDDVKRDSEAAERRILSTAPDVVFPARRVVSIGDQNFILGHSSPDHFLGRAIRQGVVVHEAPYSVQVRTLAQACLDQAGTSAWGNKFTVKNVAFSEQDSSLTPQIHVHLASSESAPVGRLLTVDGRHYLVRLAETGPAGTLVVTADEQVGAIVTGATVFTGAYDPITDTQVRTPVIARVLKLRWQSIFSYGNSNDSAFGPDEEQFAVAKATFTPLVGWRISLPDGSTWQVSSVVSFEDAWLCRAVRHAGG